MNQLTRKIFNLSEIRYSWLLLISLGIFLVSLYTGKVNPEITSTVEFAMYGSAFMIAVIWGLLNYIDHIKVSANYKKCDNIDVYVNNLVMSKDERTELKAYLDDYVNDLMEQGKTREDAIKLAISQFNVQEFASLSKNSSLLNLPTHSYLIGYMLIATFSVALLHILANTVFSNSFWLLAIEFTLGSYGIGFLGLFFLYKLIDIVLGKKLETEREN